MLTNIEKRYITSPSSFSGRKKKYAKQRVQKKIDDMGHDIKFLIENNFDLSKILDVMQETTDVAVRQKVAQLSKTLETLSGIKIDTSKIDDIGNANDDDSSSVAAVDSEQSSQDESTWDC